MDNMKKYCCCFIKLGPDISQSFPNYLKIMEKMCFLFDQINASNISCAVTSKQIFNKNKHINNVNWQR